jgi:pyruvate,water dikinase
VLVVEISAASTLPFEGSGGFPRRTLVGGKGLSLAHLAARGFAIPATAVFTTRLFRAHVPDLRNLERALASGKRPGARDLARARRDVNRPLERKLEAAVTGALEALLARSRSGKLALRSSAVGEDAEETSFAGLHDSFLALASLEDARTALHRCWESLLSERALEYRRLRRIGSPLLMAVVAQEHVEAVAAGVAFSAVGWGERRRLVVELAPPGDSAPVTGAETPLRFEVPRVPGGGASRGDVALASAPLGAALSPDRALDVVRLALQAEEMLGGPADIEWLLEPRGSLVLVQARPARAATPPRFDRTAVAESLPAAVTPLARGFLERAYARAFAEHYLAPIELTAPILAYRAGRFYLDLAAQGNASARGKTTEVRDERRRARTERVLRDARRALEKIGALVLRAKDLARLHTRTLRELDRLLPLYLLAQDDVSLVQDAFLRTRARLGLPVGAPPVFESGGAELARALARAGGEIRAGRFESRAVKDLLRRFGHRGGIELDLASPSLSEALPALAASGSLDAGPRNALPDEHPALRGLRAHGRRVARRADRLRDAVTLAVRVERAIVLRFATSVARASRPSALGGRDARPTDERTPDIFFFTLDELERALEGRRPRPNVARRRGSFERETARIPPLAADDPEREEVLAAETGDDLRGIAASSGTARGRARVVRSAEDVKALEPGEVLVAHAATAELFGSLFGAQGLVTDVGGMLSHGAVLARELGIPAVVATERASSWIRTGDLVLVDGERGLVRLLRES